MDSCPNERALNNSREEIPSVPMPNKDNTILAGLPEMLTSAQVAAVLQCSPNTVRQFLREGNLPSIRLGQQYRVPKSWLEAWLRETSQGGGSQW